MGMTDLQFKAYNKHLLRRIEALKKIIETLEEGEAKEQLQKQLEELLVDLQEMIES